VQVSWGMRSLGECSAGNESGENSWLRCHSSSGTTCSGTCLLVLALAMTETLARLSFIIPASSSIVSLSLAIPEPSDGDVGRRTRREEKGMYAAAPAQLR
jgi:hypothetical protein